MNIVYVISNLNVVTVNKYPNNGLLPPFFNFFFSRVPLNVLVCTPGWESPLQGIAFMPSSVLAIISISSENAEYCASCMDTSVPNDFLHCQIKR